jgi:hypothetical protein
VSSERCQEQEELHFSRKECDQWGSQRIRRCLCLKRDLEYRASGGRTAEGRCAEQAFTVDQEQFVDRDAAIAGWRVGKRAR